MKRKSRFFATALATAMCATSILGLVACSKDAGDLMDGLEGDPTDAGVYTVTLNANGGSFASGVKTTLTTTNGKITEALPTASQVTRTGYTFGGWYTAAQGGTAVSITTFTVSSDGTTLYVHWTENQSGNQGGDNTGGNGGNGQTSSDIIITFNANGGTLTGAETATAVDGKVTKPTDPNPADGYEFLGWGKEEMVNPSQMIDFTTEKFTQSTTLYAQWGEVQGGGGDLWNDDRVNVESGLGNNGHDDIQKIYLVGKFGNMTAFDNTKGYFMECTNYAGEFNFECSVTVTLSEGDIVAIYVPGWPYTIPFSAIENADNFTEVSDGYSVTVGGTYTFYYKHYWNSDLEHSIYIAQ